MLTLNLTLPIYWVNQKKTKRSTTHLVSLNFFRNAHYHIQNKLKQDFHELVLNQLPKDLGQFTKFTTHYKLYYRNPSCDGPNVVPMIEKFLLDALQESNIITNDNVQFCVGGSWEVVSQDKLNPRCEITIKETDD